MNELKPMGWLYKRTDLTKTVFSCERWQADYVTKDWVEIPLHAIPDTHRVVSVEFLQLLRSLSVANGHENTARQLRAIINNKEAT